MAENIDDVPVEVAKAVPRAREGIAGESVSELVEQVGRDAGTLAFRSARLVAARNAPEVHRAARDLAAAAGLGIAAVTAFAFANWAAASALSIALPAWGAALVLAAGWLAAGLVVAALVLRGEQAAARRWLRSVRAEQAETRRQRERALEEAEQALRETLDRLSGAVAAAAEARIAAAILPLAGGMVETGVEMVEATDEMIEAADEITDVLEERLPGGVVVNRAVDLALVPGRFGVRVARSVLNLGDGGGSSAGRR